MGLKLWTNIEPWELRVDKMGLISKKGKKKGSENLLNVSSLFKKNILVS